MGGWVQCSLYSSPLQNIVLLFTVLKYTVLQGNALQRTGIYYATQHYTTLHFTSLNYTKQHYALLHYTTHPYTTLHSSTLLYSTLQYIGPPALLPAARRNQKALLNVWIMCSLFNPSAAKGGTVQSTAKLCSVVECSAVKYITVQYKAI